IERRTVNLNKILPRLCELAKPRKITPKYQKPPEKHFCLPGKIRDWKAHYLWLESRARPKLIYKPITPEIRSKTRSMLRTFKITSRLERLAKPRLFVSNFGMFKSCGRNKKNINPPNTPIIIY
ncbi:CLUMA_CG005117, isoform A, partial [Clunio marinus]